MSIPLIGSSPKPFAELFADKPALARAVNSFYKTIAESFIQCGGRTSESEIKRRFAICEKWFRTLRADLKWSVDRCLSELPRALVAELNGEKYEPVNRAIWLPQDGLE